MKYIKQLLVFFIVTTVFNACTEEETSYAFQNISAPSNIQATFNIAQDDTGNVSVSPTADGATIFEVYFGDTDSEVATEVAPGETISYTYTEGVYNLRIIAIGATGLTSELSREVVISFAAPTNLEIATVATTTNPLEVTVTPTATNATMFDVYFGDVDQEEPTSIMAGEEVSYTYAEAGSYTIRVVAKGAGAATLEGTKEFVASALLQPFAPASTPSNSAIDVISVFSDVYDNPDPIDYNPNWGQSTSYNQIVVEGDNIIQYGDLTYQGIDFNTAPINASEMEFIHVDIWTADDEFAAKISPISSGPNEAAYDLSLVANQWTSFDIPISFFTDANPAVDFSNIIQFKFDGVPSGEGTIFVDNLYFYKSASVMTMPTLPVDFESETLDYGIASFGGPNFEPIPAAIIDNPDASGVNTTSKVFEIEKVSGAQVWAGAGISLAGPADFSEGTTIEVDVWSPTAGTPILYKMEDSNSAPDANGNPSVIVEVEVSTTVANQWETLTFDLTTFAGFSTSNSYDKVILFPNFNNSGTGSTYYFDNFRISGATLQSPTIPVNFESSLLDYDVASFGGPNFEPIPAAIIDNPDASGINVSGKVFMIEKVSGAQVWAGAGISLAGPADFSGGTTVEVDVWSPTAGTPILYKMEDSNSAPDANGNPSVIVEVEVSTTVANQWETLTFDLTTFAGFSTSNSYDKVILFPNFNNSGAGNTYYFDNIKLIN